MRELNTNQDMFDKSWVGYMLDMRPVCKNSVIALLTARAAYLPHACHIKQRPLRATGHGSAWRVRRLTCRRVGRAVEQPYSFKLRENGAFYYVFYFLYC